MSLESDNPRDDQQLDRPVAGSHAASAAQGEWVRLAVQKYEGPLTAYARHVLGGDADRSRDIVQEAFLRLIGQDPAKIGAHLAEWLYTVCRNLAIDMKRKDRRAERLSDADADSAVSADPQPGERPERDDAMAHVLRSMQRLPRNQQECIRLKFQGGLSYKEISGVTNLTVTNVGFLIHTGLKTLRQRMAEAEETRQSATGSSRTTPQAKRPSTPMARKEI